MPALPCEKIQDLLFTARNGCQGLYDGACSLPCCLSGWGKKHLKKEKKKTQRITFEHLPKTCDRITDKTHQQDGQTASERLYLSQPIVVSQFEQARKQAL